MSSHTSVRSITAALSVAVLAVLSTACGRGGDAVIEVTGDTGLCTEVGTTWSGDAPAGAAVPGLVLERTVTCPQNSMSDERLVGAYASEFRCEFSVQGDVTVGDCVHDSTITNEGGSWEEQGGSFTITLSPGEPTAIVEEGVREGTGDYEGLRFVYATGGGTSYPWPITGTIEPSD